MFFNEDGARILRNVTHIQQLDDATELALFAQNPHPAMRLAAVLNEHCPAEALIQVVKSSKSSFEIKLEALRHPNFPKEKYLELQNARLHKDLKLICRHLYKASNPSQNWGMGLDAI